MEKRENIRLEKTLPVKFDLAEPLVLNEGQDVQAKAAGRMFEALGRNISEGGMFIESGSLQNNEDFMLNRDALLNLEIELLGQSRRIKPQGRIEWISRKSRAPHKRRSGFGLRFIQITPEDKRAVGAFISREMFTRSEVMEKDISLISGEQKLTDRQRRNMEVLDSIRKNRLISRAEISKTTGINVVTVSNYIDTYLKKGLVFERGLDISTGGRRPELIEINPRYGYVVGVDLGFLNEEEAAVNVVSADFAVRVQARAAAKREADIEDVLSTLKSLIADVCASPRVEREKIRGIGIGVSGIMDKFAGTVRNPLTGETFLNYVAIKKALEDEFYLPVFIESSPSCALFAEKWNGVSAEVKNADNILYIFSDSQCAIMLKGELYTGLSKSAGQLNFASPRNDVNSADCCWMKPSLDCILRSRLPGAGVSPSSKEDAFTAGTKLGAKIAYLVNLFNPQVVIVGGYFHHLGDVFLDSIRRTVSRWAFRESANLVRVIDGTLGEDAVAQGAASLVIESVFANI